MAVFTRATESFAQGGPLLHGSAQDLTGSKSRAKADPCTLARLLFGLSGARFTGAIHVTAPLEGTEQQHALFLRHGRVVHVRPPTLDEPLGHILHRMGLLDRDTYARSLLTMAEERVRHGTVLKKMGIVNDEQLLGALAIQILRRSSVMFRLRAGRYAIEASDHEYGREGELAASGVGVRRVIYKGVVTGYEESDLVWELNGLAGRRVRLLRHEARRLGRYGFGHEARDILRELTAEFVDLRSLLVSLAQPGRATTPALKVLYTLLITEMLEIEAASTHVVETRRPAPHTHQPDRSVATPLPAVETGRPVTTAPAPAHRVQRNGSAASAAAAAPAVPAGSTARPAAHTARSAARPRKVPDPQAATTIWPSPLRRGGRPTAIPAAKAASLETLERFRKGSSAPSSSTFGDEPMAHDQRSLEAQSRFVRGEAYLRKGEIAMALANLRSAVHLRPENADYKAMLAWASWSEPKVDAPLRAAKARRLLGEALALSPSCALAFRVFGIIYAECGEIEHGIRCFAKVLQLLPEDIDAEREMRRLERKRERPSLLDLFRRNK